MFRLKEIPFIFKNHYPLFVKKSGIAGRGVFTWRAIPEGTMLHKLKGMIITHDYSPEFSKEGPNWIGTGYREWLIPEADDIALFINHSCQPNAIFTLDHELVTLKDIEVHDEILIDYSTTELDPYWSMECNCQSSLCRRLIRSFQFLPQALKEKYEPYLHPDFLIR